MQQLKGEKKKAEEERTELPIEELTFKCLHHFWTRPIFSSPLFMVSFSQWATTDCNK